VQPLGFLETSILLDWVIASSVFGLTRTMAHSKDLILSISKVMGWSQA
jgi:hypothetical protein